MLPEEALAAAEAEGLSLVRADTPTGFWAVRKQGHKYSANPRLPGENNARYLGMFQCAEEAALEIARRVPGATEICASQGARQSAKKRARDECPTLTLDEVKAKAAEENLTLLYDSANSTGFHGVYLRNGLRFRASILGKKTPRHLGSFPTPQPAALAIARELGPQKSAVRASEPIRGSGGWVPSAERTMGAAEAIQLANEEGLILRRAQHHSGFWNVVPGRLLANGTQPWRSHVLGPDSKLVYLGTYGCPEAAALAIARRLRDDPILRAHVEARHAAAAQSSVLEVETVVIDAWSDDEENGEGSAITVEAAACSSPVGHTH